MVRLLVVIALVAWAEPAPYARAVSGAVATVHALASQAAIETLEEGGNAIDAAAAAALMLGVVDGQNSGIGGGCFALVRLPSGRVFAVDGRETAPAAATRDLFIRGGKAQPELSLKGPLAVGVPGEVAALEWMTRRWGRLPLRRALERAIAVADAGFLVTPHYANRLAQEAAILREFPEAARVFLKPDGSPWREGERLHQPDLAQTYRTLATEGTRWFYRGAFARAAGEWMSNHGGILTALDFRRYRVRLREPVWSTYRGYTVIGFPPPSSGGVHVAQALNILESFNLARLGPESAELAHLLGEALKAVFADRAYWLGDPDFTRVPRGLASEEYANALAQRIRPDQAVPVPGAGRPPDAEGDYFGKHTTHLSVADGDGHWVALTATINTTFGSKVVIPGTGVILNNQMDDFAAQPGVTNYFGLVGAEANSVAPGKRPLSSMSPTIVLKDGQPILAVGAAGGPTIISQTVRALVNTVDFGMRPGAALAAPRVHHQWRPDELVLEQGWAPETEAALKQRGHRVRRVKSLGAAQAVAIDGLGGFEAAADPRVGGDARVTSEALRN